MKTAAEIQSALLQFSGSDTFTKWSPLFPGSVITDGALYVAEECGAYWLMDAIASWQHDPKVKGEEFQVWQLTRYVTSGEERWDLIADDGNGNQLALQAIEFSDFPLAGIKFFAVRNELGGITIMLPGEY